MTTLFDFHNMFTNQNRNTIIFFKGNFSKEILHELANSLKNQLADNEQKQISRRIFAIFIELAQNIYYYSAEKINIEDNMMGDGIVHIYSENNYYVIQSGNVILKNEQQKVSSKIDMINSKSRKELKEIKKGIIQKERTREGAGFGLIEVALQAKAKLKLEFTEINEELCFIKIEVKVKKEI